MLRITPASPKLVEDLSQRSEPRELLRVMRNLLREGSRCAICARCSRPSLIASATKNTDILVEYVRYRLGFGHLLWSR